MDERCRKRGMGEVFKGRKEEEKGGRGEIGERLDKGR